MTSSVGIVLVIAAALIIAKITTGAGSPKTGTTAAAAQQKVITAVATVPAAVLNQIGAGTLSAAPKKIAAPLVSDGKPEVLYVGAEYCPYCATERWALAVALSRFGKFSDLGQTASSPSDIFPSTATLSFHGATFRSSSMSFTGKEIQSNRVVNGTYATLDTLTHAQQTLLTTFDKSGGIPFIDIGGKYVISGATYNPAVLAGKNHTQIAAALSDATSRIAKGVDGSANVITAAVCASTADKPTAVCTSPGVRRAAAKLRS